MRFVNNHMVSEEVRRKIGLANSGDRNGRWKGGISTNNKCLDCGCLISRKSIRCFECFGKYQSKRQLGFNNPNYRNGKSNEPYPLLFNTQIKERVRVRDNFKCRLCGIPELECKRRLDIHHIDYNKENGKEDNLISLCPRCHAKVNFNKEYWQKYFSTEVIRL
uniref:Putative homing endonuclease n=1 Tax=viral metagenome TaxID=1070528 RepID=A0A6M3LHM0_9ZZZZ